MSWRKRGMMDKTYKLIPLVDLNREAQLQVLKIRNEEYIRQWMFTGNEISADDHLLWIEQIRNDKSQICLTIINDSTQPVGAVNIKKIDKNNGNAELGFYKSQDFDEKGLMTVSLSAVINYSFDILGLEKIYSEVFENNTKSVNIFKRLCFMEEGFLRSHIVNNGKRISIHLFGLLKNEWQTGRDKIIFRNDIIIIPPPPPRLILARIELFLSCCGEYTA
jgi:UDP-4-amino-4,6-dideoxy-N-acetyl-beta-L-altrosamine N-acetyltransferase